MMKKIITPAYHIYYPLKVARSKIAGKGAFALQKIPRKKKIGDLGGVIIPMRQALQLIKGDKVINMVELENGLALNASANPNDMKFINHSCEPNTYMRVLKNRVEFYALRTIHKGEELSCDYGETHHEGTLPCRCGTRKCKGFI